MKTQLLIPAAGAGARLGCAGPKALVALAAEPLLVRTLRRFAGPGLVEGAVIVVPPGHERAFAAILAKAFPNTPFVFAPGGAERQISVANGLNHLDAATEIVVIHDAARPFVSAESVQASIAAAESYGAASVAIPSVDTVFVSDEERFLIATVERQRLWLCQTPQTFQASVIREAHALAQLDNYLGTDDASLVRRMGEPVKLVVGTRLNFKVTTPADLALAEYLIREGFA